MKFIFILSLFIWNAVYAEPIFPLRNLTHVYLAGPLFNARERLEMEQIASVLEAEGFQTFLPHRDGFLLAYIQPFIVENFGISSEMAAAMTARAVDALDVYQVIVANGSLVVNLNGRVPDEGAVIENTMAWILGKPAVAYRDDFRVLTMSIQNPLVSGRTDFVQVREIAKIPSALKTQIELMQHASESSFNPTPRVSERISEGKALWDLLKKVRTSGFDAQRETEAIAKLIMILYGCEGKL